MSDFDGLNEQRDDNDPSEELHAGFFVPPPAEIGALVRVWTSMGPTEEPKSPGTRLIWSFVGLGAGAAIGYLIIYFVNVKSPGWQAVWQVGFPVAGAVLAWVCTAFRHTCGYVGKEGVARYCCAGSRTNISKREIFFFGDATELRYGATRHYTNGSYNGTEYHFIWTNSHGREVFKVAGKHHAEKELPVPTDEYHLGRVCEQGWNLYLLENVVPHALQEIGYVQFNLKDRGYVRVGNGFIDFALKRGESRHCSAEDLNLEEATMGNGKLCFKRKDARVGWFSSSGVFEFEYSQLANADLFLFLFRVLVVAAAEEKNKGKYQEFMADLAQQDGDTWGADSEQLLTSFRAAPRGPGGYS